jgi:hypothetical protein
MVRPKVTGAGMQRLQTLDEALPHVQTLHSLTERMALAVRTGQPLHPIAQQLKRASVPLADLLKGHFGMLSDQVTHLYLVASRGGGDRVRVNNLREAVGAIRNAIDIAVRKVYEDYAEPDKDEIED